MEKKLQPVSVTIQPSHPENSIRQRELESLLSIFGTAMLNAVGDALSWTTGQEKMDRIWEGLDQVNKEMPARVREAVGQMYRLEP